MGSQNQIAAAALDGVHSFDFLFGHWNVTHQRLKKRLVGNDEWEVFQGTCHGWPLLGGAGNVDDNYLELPAGAYRAASIRKYDATLNKWSIWWLDGRSGGLEPPVHGAFADDVGLFYGEDVFEGRPIKVRFRWQDMATDMPRWEQAFSDNGGEDWEVNWTMTFEREPVQGSAD